MTVSKVAPWTLYSVRAKAGKIEICHYINLAPLIGTDKLIGKIKITD